MSKGKESEWGDYASEGIAPAFCTRCDEKSGISVARESRLIASGGVPTRICSRCGSRDSVVTDSDPRYHKRKWAEKEDIMEKDKEVNPDRSTRKLVVGGFDIDLSYESEYWQDTGETSWIWTLVVTSKNGGGRIVGTYTGSEPTAKEAEKCAEALISTIRVMAADILAFNEKNGTV